MKTLKNRLASSRGYTIIEVMIFLAVSGFMFILAAVFINGKQAQVVYQQSMQAAGATLTNVINNVANGEYQPLPDNVMCVVSGSGTPQFQVNNGDQSSQGSNGGCLFMGKVLQFGTSSDLTNYKTYTVAGRQFAAGNSNLEPVQTFANAMPLVAEGSNPQFDLTESDALEQGLNFDSAYECDVTCSGSNLTQIGGVGFFGSFGSYSASAAGSQSSGAQTVSILAMPVTSDMANTIDHLNTTGDNNALTSQQYIVLCFKLGNKPGSVQIGGQNGQQTSVSVNFNKQAPC